MEIKQVVEKFFSEKELATSTKKGYRLSIGRFIEALGINTSSDLNELKPSEYVSYTRGLLEECSASSVNKYIRNIDTFLGWMFDEYLLDEHNLFGQNLNHGSRRKKWYKEENKQKELITDEEYLAMKDVCKDEQETITIATLRYTAVRAGELARMKFSDVERKELVSEDGKKSVFYQILLQETKTGADRWAVLSKELYDIICFHMLTRENKSDYILISTRGTSSDSLSKTSIYMRVKRIASRAFPDASEEYLSKFHPHRFRASTFSAWERTKGLSSEVASRMLGDGLGVAKKHYSLPPEEALLYGYETVGMKI